MEQKICDTFSLDSNTLITMYNNVHNNEKELCGYFNYFKQQDDIISLKIKDNSRFFTSYEYHSHPAIISKSYPSYEDINTIYKHRNKDVSVIATQWGIYTIKKPYEFRNKYPNIPKTILSEMLNKHFYTIEKVRKKLPLTEKDINKIKRGCDSITRYTGLITRFCYWDDLL
jgi:hypothetical protein